jgi:hypothetical protein
LLYRSSPDGYSFTAVAGAVRNKDALLMVVLTRAGDVLGPFANTGVALNAQKVIQKAESFVCTYTPDFVSYPAVGAANF